MQNQIPEFDHGVYGAYMIKHMASNKVYVSYGELAYAFRYEFFMLLLGIHPNNELQSLYQDNDDICFISYTTFKTLEESAEYGQRLFDFFWSTKRLTNVGEEIQQVNCVHSNQYVESIYDTSKFGTDVYNDFCVYTIYNPHTKVFYIGSGDRDTRKYRHFNDLEKNKHGNRKFQKAYCDDDRFEFFWVPVSSRKEAYAFEQNLIDKFWGKKEFLNLSSLVCVSDGMKGQKHTEETKAKISTSSKKMWEELGRKEELAQRSKTMWENLSEEERASRVNVHKEVTAALWKDEQYRLNVVTGIKESWTEERREKMGQIVSERTNRPEVKEKYSEQRKRDWQNEEYRQKVTAGIKAYSNREDVKKIRSQKSTEYSNRPEVKLARSLAMKKRLENVEYKKSNNEKLKNSNLKRSKGIDIDGVVYQSIREASRLTGIHRPTIKRGIDSGIYKLVE